ncbi:hypothetical protein EVAR_53410_1 [Eumeta japonica]|uniref:Uncharacterized protein n=1 Tax=Eumeta variegata TaxID=151549 RepID=A0A4C1XPF6_EUMVA|nr:hypothetical protein EVAR_53410_1 [Eumeta japonica]
MSRSASEARVVGSVRFVLHLSPLYSISLAQKIHSGPDLRGGKPGICPERHKMKGGKTDLFLSFNLAISHPPPKLGLMMKPEGRRWYYPTKQRSLAVFGLVNIVVEYSLAMIGFQVLITELEVWKLHHQILKVNRDENTFQSNSNKPKYG